METNKAMNEELKSAEESRKYLISEGLDPDQIVKEGMVFIKTVKENLELKKQLKEKEGEIEELKDINNKFHERINIDREVKESLKLELTKSNEMNEMLAVEFAEWILKNYTSEYYPSQGWVWERVDTILPPSKTTKELLNEYQNPKK